MAMRELNVKIQTLSPVILTAANDSQVMTATQQLIPGSVLRGILATRYIQEQRLGKDAHRDAGFRQLFFEKLRFLPVQPEQNGKRAFALPLSLLKEKAKAGETAKIQDSLLSDEHPDNYKSFRGMAVRTAKGLEPVSVSTSISLHMTRSDALRRLLGSSQDGGIFNYEAIDAGQTFLGSIIGEHEDLVALQKGLSYSSKGLTCHLGRSKYTEYGLCRLNFLSEDAVSDLPQTEDVEKQAVLLRLDSDYLPAVVPSPAQVPNAEQELQNELQAKLGKEFHLTKVFAKAMSTGHFVGVWSMQQPRAVGLAAGTAFELQKDSAWTMADMQKLSALAVSGIGRRTAEGFGQLRVWPREKVALAEKQEQKAGFHTLPRELLPLPASIRQQVKEILLHRIKEQLRMYAYEDAQGLRMPKGSQHFFSELANILRSAQQGNGSTRKQMEAALAAKKDYRDDYLRDKQTKSVAKFQKYLSGIYFTDGHALGDFFHGSVLPYDKSQTRSWKRDLSGDEAHLDQLLQDASLQEKDFQLDDGECYFEYWRWFCRFARKRARQVGRDA